MVSALHKESIARFGGSDGLRDEGLLQSALARPCNRAAYEEDASVFALAADYCLGIARNHPFVDGNKRTAFVAAEVFLDLNGPTVTASDEECVLTMVRLAAGEMDESEYAAWLRANSIQQS